MTFKLITAMRKQRETAANKARARVVALSVIVRLLSIIINDAFNDVSTHKRKVLRRRRVSVYQTILQEVTL